MQAMAAWHTEVGSAGRSAILEAARLAAFPEATASVTEGTDPLPVPQFDYAEDSDSDDEGDGVHAYAGEAAAARRNPTRVPVQTHPSASQPERQLDEPNEDEAVARMLAEQDDERSEAAFRGRLFADYESTCNARRGPVSETEDVVTVTPMVPGVYPQPELECDTSAPVPLAAARNDHKGAREDVKVFPHHGFSPARMHFESLSRAAWIEHPIIPGAILVFSPCNSHMCKNLKNNVSSSSVDGSLGRAMVYPVEHNASEGKEEHVTFHPIDFTVIQAAYEWQRANLTSTLVTGLTHTAVYPDSRSKMSHKTLRALCNPRVIRLLEFIQEVDPGALGGVDVSGTVEYLKDMWVFYVTVSSQHNQLYYGTDSPLLDKAIQVYFKWEHHRELIAEHSKLTFTNARDLSKMHVTNATFRALELSLFGFFVDLHQHTRMGRSVDTTYTHITDGK